MAKNEGVARIQAFVKRLREQGVEPAVTPQTAQEFRDRYGLELAEHGIMVMAPPEGAVMVGMRVKDGASAMKDAETRSCELCGEACWVQPGMDKCEMRCVQCAQTELAHGRAGKVH